MALALLALCAQHGLAIAQERTLCVHDVGPGQHLNVRKAPTLTATILARLPSDTCGIKLVGRCQGNWCEMAHGERRGWVDTRYIGVFEYPPDEQQVRAPPDAASAASAGGPAADAPKPSSPSSKPALDAAAGQARPSVVRRQAKPRRTVAKAPAPKGQAMSRAPQSHPSRHRHAACVVRVAGWDTLRLRTGPGTRFREVGRIPPWSCHVQRLGGCDGEWCRVAWHGRSGWVNTYYLENDRSGVRRPRWWRSIVLAFCRF